MTNDPPPKNVAVLVPRRHEFEMRVRRLAQDSSRVVWTFHARERMRERDISNRVALTVIREGVVMGEIEPGANPGELKAKIVRNMRGRRDVGVVVLLVRNDRLVVKTVEWEDLR